MKVFGLAARGRLRLVGRGRSPNGKAWRKSTSIGLQWRLYRGKATPHRIKCREAIRHITKENLQGGTTTFHGDRTRLTPWIHRVSEDEAFVSFLFSLSSETALSSLILHAFVFIESQHAGESFRIFGKANRNRVEWVCWILNPIGGQRREVNPSVNNQQCLVIEGWAGQRLLLRSGFLHPPMHIGSMTLSFDYGMLRGVNKQSLV